VTEISFQVTPWLLSQGNEADYEIPLGQLVSKVKLEPWTPWIPSSSANNLAKNFSPRNGNCRQKEVAFLVYKKEIWVMILKHWVQVFMLKNARKK